MRFAIFSMVVCCAVSAFAQPTKPTNKSTAKNQPPALKRPITLYETFDNDGIGFGFRGDLLYMVYQSPILTYAAEQAVSNQVLNSHIFNVPGKLSLGCDIALTYTMPNQPGYSFEAGWYHIVAKLGRNVNSNHLVPAHVVTLLYPAVANGAIKSHVTINFFDLLLKKDFAFGEWVDMTPVAGFIGGYMDGTSSAHFVASSGTFSSPEGVTAAHLAYKTKFEGLGIKLGGCFAFKIWRGFSLKADLFYSVLYGLTKATLDYSQNFVSPIPAGSINGVIARYTQHHSRAFFDTLLGLAWGRAFCNDGYFIDLHAGWRFQTFFDGWEQFEAEINDSLHALNFSGQGLQAGATFKF